VKWYQLHLSTLLAVTLLAGVFLWLNVRTVVEWGKSEKSWVAPEWTNTDRNHWRGWPISYSVERYLLVDERESAKSANIVKSSEELLFTAWGWKPLLEDVIICLTMLVFVVTIIEWITRRMKLEETSGAGRSRD
jgi:hypothetical protein